MHTIFPGSENRRPCVICASTRYRASAWRELFAAASRCESSAAPPSCSSAASVRGAGKCSDSDARRTSSIPRSVLMPSVSPCSERMDSSVMPRGIASDPAGRLRRGVGATKPPAVVTPAVPAAAVIATRNSRRLFVIDGSPAASVLVHVAALFHQRRIRYLELHCNLRSLTIIRGDCDRVRIQDFPERVRGDRGGSLVRSRRPMLL